MRYALILLAALSFPLLSFTTMVILEEHKMLDGKVSLSVPKNFKPMTEDALAKKYRMAQHPKLVYADPEGNVRVAINHTQSKASQDSIKKFVDDFTTAFSNTFSKPKWKGNGVKKINGRDVGYLELIITGGMNPAYNLMFFTDVDGRLALFTFTCPETQINDWQVTASDIMQSLKVH